MSAQELKKFEAQLALLSFAEQLSLMEYLARIMQQKQEAHEMSVQPKKRRFGSAKGKFVYPVNFDEDNEEIARLLLAQAKTDGLTFLTHDTLIPYYDEPCVCKA